VRRAALLGLLCAACAGAPGARGVDAPVQDGGLDAGALDAGPLDAGSLDAGPLDAGPLDAGPLDAGPPCTTTLTYGTAWIAPAGRVGSTDLVSGEVTWDGACVEDGANSYALLSNGWKPYFQGHGRCVLALDTAHCAAPSPCATRATYGPAWLAPSGHLDRFDDVAGRLLWDGRCRAAGTNSTTTLSNGWTPNFTGSDTCSISLRHTGCGGLYANPVLPQGCADPGVLRDGSGYVLACTSGNAGSAFPISTSSDLVHWTRAGSIFPAGSRPSWATGDFWAPEIHHVGNHFVAYFSARHLDGQLSVGAASAPSALGPFTDLGAPLVHSASGGVIDVTEFEDGSGQPYLVWKVDGNATGQPTPILAQPLSADGLSLLGSPTQLITNDLAWEGAVTEGPFVIRSHGDYFLFYSGNSYANGTYALGVARSTNPLGPYVKFGPPIVHTRGVWVGPGHCSVVTAPSGELALVYHAWLAGAVNTPGSVRHLLVDTLTFINGWPQALVDPTETSQPLP
jgi:arabinan endo-1,5-alpha-L-arabinosidase